MSRLSPGLSLPPRARAGGAYGALDRPLSLSGRVDDDRLVVMIEDAWQGRDCMYLADRHGREGAAGGSNDDEKPVVCLVYNGQLGGVAVGCVGGGNRLRSRRAYGVRRIDEGAAQANGSARHSNPANSANAEGWALLCVCVASGRVAQGKKQVQYT